MMPGERVVQLVRDAGDELADARHLLRLQQPLLHQPRLAALRVEALDRLRDVAAPSRSSSARCSCVSGCGQSMRSIPVTAPADDQRRILVRVRLAIELPRAASERDHAPGLRSATSRGPCPASSTNAASACTCTPSIDGGAERARGEHRHDVPAVLAQHGDGEVEAERGPRWRSRTRVRRSTAPKGRSGASTSGRGGRVRDDHAGGDYSAVARRPISPRRLSLLP